jgi:hypothetical protein
MHSSGIEAKRWLCFFGGGFSAGGGLECDITHLWLGLASTSLSHHDFAQPTRLHSATGAFPLDTHHSPLATHHPPLPTPPLQYTQRIFDDDFHEEERIAVNTATPLETFFFIFELCSSMLFKSTPSKITFRRGRY